MQEFTVSIAADMAEKLDKLAAKVGRSPSFLASKALEEFVSRETWQVAEIEAGRAGAWDLFASVLSPNVARGQAPEPMLSMTTFRGAAWLRSRFPLTSTSAMRCVFG